MHRFRRNPSIASFSNIFCRALWHFKNDTEITGEEGEEEGIKRALVWHPPSPAKRVKPLCFNSRALWVNVKCWERDSSNMCAYKEVVTHKKCQKGVFWARREFGHEWYLYILSNLFGQVRGAHGCLHEFQKSKLYFLSLNSFNGFKKKNPLTWRFCGILDHLGQS